MSFRFMLCNISQSAGSAEVIYEKVGVAVVRFTPILTFSPQGGRDNMTLIGMCS